MNSTFLAHWQGWETVTIFFFDFMFTRHIVGIFYWPFRTSRLPTLALSNLFHYRSCLSRTHRLIIITQSGWLAEYLSFYHLFWEKNVRKTITDMNQRGLVATVCMQVGKDVVQMLQSAMDRQKGSIQVKVACLVCNDRHKCESHPRWSDFAIIVWALDIGTFLSWNMERHNEPKLFLKNILHSISRTYEED